MNENDEITITTKMRSLGYGWTTKPTDEGTLIEEPTEDVRGGLRTVEDERNHAFEINQPGTFLREDLFVGRRRVVEMYAIFGSHADYECDTDGCNDHYRNDWCMSTVGWILSELRKTGSIRVRLENIE